MKKTTYVPSSNDHQSQFALLKTRRFGPFFWTQFWGAFNDNLYKTALAIVLAFRVSEIGGANSHYMVNLAAGLFILPFFLFSALAGQLADKFEKSALIRRIKMAEIVIMGCAGAALVLNWTWLLLILLFAMGTQSAFFGPVKYSLLPQHLRSREIVGGNGMVEMGTFVAILLGTLAGGLLISGVDGRYWVAVGIILAALAGWGASRKIPLAKAAEPDLKMDCNIFFQTCRILSRAQKDRTVFLPMVGISWFWFLGSAYVTQLPNYVRQVLYCDPSVVTLLLAIFSIGVATGSLLCDRLSGKRVELGLIPLGALGMGLFGWDFARGCPGLLHMAPLAQPPLLGAGQFLHSAGSWRVLMDLALLGVGGGLYIVPLFAWLQIKTPRAMRSRMIAANNVLNALFMVLSSVLAALLLGIWHMPILQFYTFLAGGSLVAGICIIFLAPVYVLRLAVWLMTRLVYRVRCEGLERIPENGPAVLVCNHVSYMDALIIAGSCRRPVRFVMHAAYYRIPVLRWVFRLAGVIPIDSARKNPALLHQAFKRIAATLQSGELVCIFPEGRLTRNGDIHRFRPGIEKIIQHNPVPVIPLALRGLWGSFFSCKGGHAMGSWPRRFWSRIELAVGDMIHPRKVTAGHLQSVVESLRGQWA